MTLFDKSRVPPAVFRAEAYAYLDSLISNLRARLAAKISIQEPGTTFRLPGMAQALSQAFMWRCVAVTEATADLCNRGCWLPAIIMARALIETVAAFHHFTKGLARELDTGDLQRLHDYIHGRTFATRADGLLAVADETAKAPNILTQVDALAAFRKDVRADYEHLSEYAHPNSLGTFLFFGEHDTAEDVVRFQSDGFTASDWLRWAGAACSTLNAAVASADLIDELAAKISALGKQARGEPKSA